MSVQLMARIATDWARRCFGSDHVSNLPMRALRTLEECTELAQSLGLERATAIQCVNTIYDRPVGEPQQEIGATLLTTVILCESMGLDPVEMLERELRRVLKKSPDHFAKRNQEKIDLGLDACAQSSGGPIPRTASPYLHKCKRRRLDGPTPCLCCKGECIG